MSNFGGPNSAFEKEIESLIKPISKRLTVLEDDMYTLMMKSLRSGQTSTAYWNKVRAELDDLYRQMNTAFAAWSEKTIPYVYKKSLVTLQNRINSLKYIQETAKRSALSIINSNYGRGIVDTLYKSATESFAGSLFAGRNNMHQLTRLTQQALLNESVFDIAVAAGFESGDLRRAARSISGQLWGKLYEAAENKRFVQAGTMKYTPEYYAELVARTKFHQSQANAGLTQAANYGTDLMQVSSHNTTTAICMEYEGKVFSISGKDKRFPLLTASSPYHPNCLHLMFPTFESGMNAQGSLAGFSDFSLGKTDKPPTPASFIPVSARSA